MIKKILYGIGFAIFLPYLIWFNWVFLSPTGIFEEMWLFFQPQDSAVVEPRSFVCTEPLPEFTLNATADPTDAQLDQLCSCVFAGLTARDRGISRTLVEGDPSEISQADIQRFIPKFANALESCGGYKL